MSFIKIALADAAEALEGSSDDFVTMMTDGEARLLLFAPKGRDKQTPHRQDEFYVVISGSGTFRREAEIVSFAAGDVLFVPAGMDHAFETQSDDFKAWVIFYGPRR